MLGVRDEFNLCLHPLEVVEVICEICRRYVFIPILQLESPLFTQMARAFYDGQKPFLPLVTFETLMFLNKRTAGLPGYQYDVDLSKETIAKKLFSDEEIRYIHAKYSEQEGYEYMKSTFIVDGNIRLLKIRRNSAKADINGNSEVSGKFTKLYDENGGKIEDAKELTPLHKLLGLTAADELTVTVLDDTDWTKHLSDSEFYRLSHKDQLYVKMRCTTNHNNLKWWGHWIGERAVNWVLGQMEKYNNSYKWWVMN